MLRNVLCLLLLALIDGCAYMHRDSGGDGSKHTRHLQQPPETAARCFARNAEEHSSALISEVRIAHDGSADVIVRVKNGVPYATAHITRAGQTSTATIVLMVRTSGSRNDLLDELVEGC